MGRFPLRRTPTCDLTFQLHGLRMTELKFEDYTRDRVEGELNRRQECMRTVFTARFERGHSAPIVCVTNPAIPTMASSSPSPFSFTSGQETCLDIIILDEMRLMEHCSVKTRHGPDPKAYLFWLHTPEFELSRTKLALLPPVSSISNGLSLWAKGEVGESSRGAMPDTQRYEFYPTGRAAHATEPQRPGWSTRVKRTLDYKTNLCVLIFCCFESTSDHLNSIAEQKSRAQQKPRTLRDSRV